MFLIHHAYEWYVGTHYHHRMFTYGLWAVGALTIGVGVCPVFVALAWALGGPVETREERALLGLFVGAIVGFGLYTAVKASYLATTFATRVEERNLIYLSPIVFVAAARWADARANAARRRRSRPRGSRRLAALDDAVPRVRAPLLRRVRALDPAVAEPDVVR